MFPIFYENSKVPVWLSKVSPIEIGAISFGLWVWSRGEVSERLKNHETIHYKQQTELLFIGHWTLYIMFWLVGLIRYRSGSIAYRENPFEREAYTHDQDLTYLNSRKHYSWVSYIWNKGERPQ